MTHRQVLEALSGLLLGLFVAILSATVVSNALPTIIADLHATEATYSWVITAELLATTVTTPIWGKLADLVSKKVLVQLGLIIYVVGSALGGLAPNAGLLISARVIQGIGVGGLTALVQVIMAAMISPRERGRYSGYIGAVFALATVAGPLIGGVIVDTDWLGWRWCFYVGLPFAVIALIVLQRTLRLPVVKREVSIDWTGAVLFSAATSLLLIWVSFAAASTTGSPGRPVRWSAARWSSPCSSSSWSSGRRSRSCRCACSPTGRSACRWWPACSSVSACTASRRSSASTSSSPGASRPRWPAS
ncbi:MFS transporter [Streptosporangium lutulentum]